MIFSFQVYIAKSGGVSYRFFRCRVCNELWYSRVDDETTDLFKDWYSEVRQEIARHYNMHLKFARGRFRVEEEEIV